MWPRTHGVHMESNQKSAEHILIHMEVLGVEKMSTMLVHKKPVSLSMWS
jgi:hypothetical protein